MDSFPIAMTIIGVVTTGFSIPMILGKVPPNRVYGIRTPAAFASDENWYRINKAGGQALLPSSILMALVGLVAFLIPADDLAFYELPAALLIIVSAAVTTRQLLRAGRGK